MRVSGRIKEENRSTYWGCSWILRRADSVPTSKFRNLHALLHEWFVYQSSLSPRKQKNGSFVQSGKLLKKAEAEWFCLHLGDYEVLFAILSFITSKAAKDSLRQARNSEGRSLRRTISRIFPATFHLFRHSTAHEEHSSQT